MEDVNKRDSERIYGSARLHRNYYLKKVKTEKELAPHQGGHREGGEGVG